MKNADNKSNTDNLSQKAVMLLKKHSPKTNLQHSEQEMLNLRESDVQRMELELENEDLMLAKSNAKEVSKKYTESFSFSPLGNFTLSEEGKIIELNLMGAKMLGKELTRLKNSQFGLYISEDSKPDFNHFIRNVFKSNKIEVCEVKLSTDNSRQVYIYLTGTFDENKQRCFMSAFDSSERKRAEEVLHQREKELLETQRLAHIGSWNWNIATDTVKWSEELYHISGRDPNSVAPCFADMFSCYTAESWNRLNEAVTKTLQNGEPYELELEIVLPDDTTRYTLAHGEADYDDYDKITGLHGTVQDITNHKKADKLLRESEDRFRLLFVEAPLAYQSLDIDGHFIEVNQQWSEMLGYTRQEVIGKYFGDFISLYNRDDFRKWFAIFKTNGRIHSEFEIVHKNGNRLIIAFDGIIAYDSDGKFKQSHCILSDITERKLIRKALQESEQKLINIIDFLPDATFVLDDENNVVAWNRAIEEMTGISKEEMIGTKDHNHLIPLYIDRGLTLEKIIDIHEKNTSSWFENVQRDGQTIEAITFSPGLYGGEGANIWVKWANLFDDNGNRIGAIESIRDITLHKNTENHLIKSTRILALLSHINHAIINIHDKNTLFEEICKISINHGKFRMAWLGVVDAKEKQLRPVAWDGIEAEYFIESNKLLNYGHTNDKSPIGFAIEEGRAVICNDIAGDQMMKYWRDDALKRGCYSSITMPIKIYNEVIGVYNLFADMPEYFNKEEVELLTNVTANIAFAIEAIDNEKVRRQAEEELKNYGLYLEETVKQRTAELESARDRAESADRVKSAFLATMSHELRTPLNSVIGFSGILLQNIPGPLNEEQRKQLKMIQASGRHLLSVINDILDLSKIEVGLLTTNFEHFNIQNVIEEVMKLEWLSAVNKGLTMKFEKNPEIEEIFSDRQRVKQVLLNLVNNAIKFTEKGSVSIVCSNNSDWVNIDVIDTGIGIKEEDFGKLFSPFIQIDSELTRKHQGSGLGLSISKKLIDLLHGTISVKSEFGTGSTFTISLPVKELEDKKFKAPKVKGS